MLMGNGGGAPLLSVVMRMCLPSHKLALKDIQRYTFLSEMFTWQAGNQDPEVKAHILPVTAQCLWKASPYIAYRQTLQDCTCAQVFPKSTGHWL